jgi:hypothetical protein
MSFTRSGLGASFRKLLLDQASPLMVITWEHPYALSKLFWPAEDVETDLLVFETGLRRPTYFFKMTAQTSAQQLLDHTTGLSSGRWPPSDALFFVGCLDAEKALAGRCQTPYEG